MQVAELDLYLNAIRDLKYCNMMTTAQRPRKVERFDSPNQIYSRPSFKADVAMRPEDLARIVGRYDFNGVRPEVRLVCGLNGCHQSHGKGLVISAITGEETICGHQCALEHLGERWENALATLSREEDEDARRAVAEEFQREQAGIEQVARSLLADCQDLERRVTAIRAHVDSQPLLRRAVVACEKAGGSIFGAAYDRPRIGTLRQLSLVVENSLSPSKLLDRVLEISEQARDVDSVASLPMDAINEKLQARVRQRESLDRVNAFARQAAEFLRPDNLAQFDQLFKHAMPFAADTASMRATINAIKAA